MKNFAEIKIVVDKYLADDAKPIPFGKDGRALFWGNGKPVWADDVDTELLPYVVGYYVSQKLYDALQECISATPLDWRGMSR